MLDHRRATLDHARLLVVCAAVPLTALVYSFQLTSFLHAKECALWLCLLPLAALTLMRGPSDSSGTRVYSPLLVLLLFSLLASVFSFFTPFDVGRVRRDVVVEVSRIAAILLFAVFSFDLFRAADARQRIQRAVVATAGIASALALAQKAGWLSFLFPPFSEESLRPYSVFGNASLLGGYLAVALPLLLHRSLTRPRYNPLETAGLSLIGAALLISGARSAWLAAFAGSLVVLCRKGIHVKRAMLLSFIAPLIVVVAVFADPNSTLDRFLLTFSESDSGLGLRWWFIVGTLRLIGRQGLIGVGAGNYPYWSPRYLGDALWAPGGSQLEHNTLHTEHAHCDPLELLAEYGLMAAVMWGWFLVRLLRFRGSEWGGLAAFAVFSLFNAPLHSAPHALVAVVLASSLLGRDRDPVVPAGSSHSRYQRTFQIAAVLVFVLGFVLFSLVPSYLLRKAETLHIRGTPSLAAYQRAATWSGAPWIAYEKYGIALLESGHFGLSQQVFARALDGLDTGAVYLGLGVAAFKNGDSATAREALLACLHRWPSKFDAWYLLMRCVDAEERSRLLERARPWLTPDEALQLATLAREGGGT